MRASRLTALFRREAENKRGILEPEFEPDLLKSYPVGKGVVIFGIEFGLDASRYGFQGQLHLGVTMLESDQPEQIIA